MTRRIAPSMFERGPGAQARDVDESSGPMAYAHADVGPHDRAFRPMLRAGERFARDAANRPILMFEDVYKSYRPGAPVLRGMNLIIERGEFVFITGPSTSMPPCELPFLPASMTVGVKSSGTKASLSPVKS